MDSARPQNFRDLIYRSLLSLATEDGINASGRDEIYGCIFGRDSALTILKILKVHKKSSHDELLKICKRSLLTLCDLQGTEVNIESGEQPGKFIHEFRKDRHEHLTRHPVKPWYLYPDQILRNYDSLDSTPIALIAIYKYWELTGDRNFLIRVLPHIEMGLNWIIYFGDTNQDDLVDYALHSDRKYGGLAVQSWTDSHESLRGQDGCFPPYPIAPVEVQSKVWLALRLWGKFYALLAPAFSRRLLYHADRVKQAFNEKFIFKDGSHYFAGQAIDGKGRLIKTVTGNPLICLWASDKKDNKVECIIDESYIDSLIGRAFQPDLFDPEAGIRTMSVYSPTFNPNRDSYHNGSFWPMLNGLATEGLENFGFEEEAALLRQASLRPIYHFNSPIELYTKDESGQLLEYLSPSGQAGCKVQAWSAASALDWLT